MSESYLMALDAGSGAGRCFLVSLDGKKALSAYQEWSYFTPPGLTAAASAFDPDTFWSIFAGVTQQALAKAGIHGNQVVAISSTSQREGAVFLGKGGKEVYAGPNRDFRAAFEGMQLANTFGDELYRRTGHYPSGLFAPARLLWHKNNLPEVYAQITALLSINDWVLYRLSGECACEPTNAAETCLYDLVNGDWAWDVIESLGLNPQIFRRILPSGTQLGVVSHQVAEQTGLRAGTPVVVGAADTQCGLTGSGAICPSNITAVSGTTTPVQMVTSMPIIDEQQRLWAGAHMIPGLFILESNAGGSGSVYQWFRDSFCQEEMAQAAAQGISPYELMNAQAEQAPVGAAGMQSHIGLMVMNAKTMGMPSNILMFGMAPLAAANQCCKPLVLRAILESLAFAVKANAQQILEVSGLSPECMTVCGGLANSRTYLEALANTLQMPVKVPVLKEGTAVGAAICAGVGAGVYRDFAEGVQALVHTGCLIEPDSRLSRQYRNFYNRWTKTRLALANLAAS
ncbi:MAG: FGGY family carbohydrate kinase [Chloroflexi bacterium]|nr:FGGY family carbohydrate kinase [Chloroflexota bacterium]